MSDATSSTPLKTCDNCKRDISETNFVIHTVHCHRNIVLCKKCDTPFPKDEIEEHIKESHSKISCTKCGVEIEQQSLEDHLATKCSKRMVICGFCNIEVPVDDRDEHEDYCGSRTDRCEGCGQYVMAKFLDIHLSSNHCFFTLDDATKPPKNKINNVDDGTEPVSLRFTHGKRTNDMPQINLDREAEKNLDWKPVLQVPALSPPKLSMEESDRLLALQVANEDADERPEDVFAADYPHDPFADHDHNFFGDSNRFSPVPRDDFRDETSTSAPFSSLARISQAIGTSINNHLFPAATSARQVETRNESDDLSLPCEFCGNLLPVDALLQHQTTCEAGDEDFEELLNTDPKPLNNSRNSPEPSDRIHRLRNPIDPLPIASNVDSTENIMIPCEYCNQLYDSSLIIEHQNLCAEMTRERSIVSPRVSPLRYGQVRSPERRQHPLQHTTLMNELLRSRNDTILNPFGRRNRYDAVPAVRDVPIAVSPNYNPDPARQAQLEDIEKENALRQLRRLKAQLSNADAPLVTSRRFAEPPVTQTNNRLTDVQPIREQETVGQPQRRTPNQGFLFPGGGTTPPNRDADYRRQTPNRPSTMNRRNF